MAFAFLKSAKDPRSWLIVSSIAVSLLFFQNCAKGFKSDSSSLGNSLNSSQPPFGSTDPGNLEMGTLNLVARLAAGTLKFPEESPTPATMDVVEAFPNLGFVNPLFMTGVPDGRNRLVVAQQNGRILIFDNNPAVTSSTTFLDIGGLISSSGGEEGLLGLAFDPNFATNGYFYVNYTAPNPLRTVVARYRVSTANPNVADPASAVTVLTVQQPYNNHNGGMMTFGPDGSLYIGLGDGGSGGDPQGNGQKLSTLLGKILRINPSTAAVPNPTYTVPADNPFVNTTGARPEIYIYGVRNPWRFSFDRGNGRLFIGDVGQNQYEEINIAKKGDNLGWNACEGKHLYGASGNCPANYVAPIWEYTHATGLSITGGYVYRGTQLSSLRGAYLYGDFVNRQIWALVYDGVNPPTNTQVGSLPLGIASFGEDQNGELYIVGYAGSSNPISKIYKLRERTTPPASQVFPNRLSQTGLFKDLATLTPADGLIPYDVNQALWSDNAEKQRWIGLPAGSQTIGFDPVEPWTCPVGSVFVKHFGLRTSASVLRRLETRVLLRQKNGWFGYTYKWNSQGTDADLLSGALTETINATDASGTRAQTWTYPSQMDCMRCHTPVAGYALGLQTAQLNRSFQYSSSTKWNQIHAFTSLGLFNKDPGVLTSLSAYANLADQQKPLADRVRSYLAVNCAHCHQANGPTPTDIDLRYKTPLGETKLVNITPTSGDLGLASAMRVRPGVAAQSVLLERMRRTDGTRMPPLGTSIPDADAIKAVGDWINGL